MEEKKINRIFYVLIFLCVLACGVILKFTASVFVPVTLSLMLSLVFLPLLKKLKKLHIPWVASILIVFALFFASAYGLFNIVISSVQKILDSYPRYETRLTSIYETIAQKFRLPYDEEQTIFANLWNQLQVRSALTKIALNMTETVYKFLQIFLTVMLFSFFLLMEMNHTKAKVEKAFESSGKDRVKIISQNIILQTTRYISIKFVISLATGIIIFFALKCVRLEFAIVWAFFSFVMNFIPTFGSIISCAITILFSILQFYPKPVPIVIISICVILTNFILGNIVEPRIAGENLGISPFVILVSLTLWGWIWGFVGMVLSVPIIVILKIICENISYLKPLAILLGNKLPESG